MFAQRLNVFNQELCTILADFRSRFGAPSTALVEDYDSKDGVVEINSVGLRRRATWTTVYEDNCYSVSKLARTSSLFRTHHLGNLLGLHTVRNTFHEARRGGEIHWQMDCEYSFCREL